MMKSFKIDEKELRKSMQKRILYSYIDEFVEDKKMNKDLNNVQQKAYDKVISQLNDFLDDIDSSIAIDLVDDLVDTMKNNHYQIGDTIYFYNRCKNQIEKFVVESVALSDRHLIYNYLYDASCVKGSYDEILRYAIDCIENDAHMKIEALKGGD